MLFLFMVNDITQAMFFNIHKNLSRVSQTLLPSATLLQSRFLSTVLIVWLYFAASKRKLYFLNSLIANCCTTSSLGVCSTSASRDVGSLGTGSLRAECLNSVHTAGPAPHGFKIIVNVGFYYRLARTISMISSAQIARGLRLT